MYKIIRKCGGSMPHSYRKHFFSYEEARCAVRKYLRAKGFRGRKHTSMFLAYVYSGIAIERV